MDRRSFFTRWISPDHSAAINDTPRVLSSAGLEPWIPDSSQSWDATRASHLLRRATFQPRQGDVATLLQMSPSDAVDLLLDTPSTPERPAVADSVTESLEGLSIDLQGQLRARWASDARNLRTWYTGVMRDSGLSIVEKMVAFWSNHFAIQFQVDQDFVLAPLLYRQNAMFRQIGLGSFREMMKQVTLDGAMLVYLGGNLNSVGRANENYAREMLELYTTGLGNYTEGDVKEGARILTGWRVAQFNDNPQPNGIFNAYFLPNFHDTGAKQYLGESFPARDASTNTEFLVRRDEVDKLIDTVFDRRSREVAEFICAKLYRFFAYSNPAADDGGVISAMADVLIANDFEIRPVMSALLKSSHFFDNAMLGAQIKTPLDYEVGLARQLGTDRNIADDVADMDQEIFEPPNVAGWPGYRTWISTTTYPVRTDVSDAVISALSDQEVIDFINRTSDPSSVSAVVLDVATLLLPRPMSTERQQALQNALLDGAPTYEWNNILTSSPSTAARNMRGMLRTIAQLPDFHLC